MSDPLLLVRLVLFPLWVAAWLAQPLAAPLWRRTARLAITAAVTARGLAPDGPIVVELAWAKRLARGAYARVPVRGAAGDRFEVDVRLYSDPGLSPRWELESFGC